jgi:hypothetical protein
MICYSADFCPFIFNTIILETKLSLGLKTYLYLGFAEFEWFFCQTRFRDVINGVLQIFQNLTTFSFGLMLLGQIKKP